MSGFPCAASSAMYAARARLTARLKDTVTACGEILNTRADRAARLGPPSAKRVVIAVVDSGIVRASPFLVSGSRRVLWRKLMFSQRISVVSDSLMPVASASVTIGGSAADSVCRMMACLSSGETLRHLPRGGSGRRPRRTGLARWSNPPFPDCPLKNRGQRCKFVSNGLGRCLCAFGRTPRASGLFGSLLKDLLEWVDRMASEGYHPRLSGGGIRAIQAVLTF